MQHLLNLAADKVDDRGKSSLRNVYLLFDFTHGRWTKVQTVNEFERNIIISLYGRSPAEIVGSYPTGDLDVCLL